MIQSSAALLYCPVCTIARISSSVNAITCLAAQNVSSGRRLTNGGRGWTVFHVRGSNVWLSNAPTSAKIGILGFHPRRRGDAKARDVAPDGAFPGDGRFVPFPRQLRSILNAAAKRSGEVDQVVTNPPNAAVVSEDILRGHCAGTAVVEPCRKHEQPAQVSSMLVKHRVVGVIAPRPPDLIRTEQ